MNIKDNILEIRKSQFLLITFLLMSIHSTGWCQWEVVGNTYQHKNSGPIGYLAAKVNPSSYPYGFNIDLDLDGTGWAREYSFSLNGTGKLFAFGAYGTNDTFHYGYIGGNTQQGIAIGNAVWMSFKPSGNIGIGTVNPSSKLHVVGTIKSLDMDVSGSIDAAQYYVNGQAINFNNAVTSVWGQSGTTVNYVEGNVGIGTATPDYQLDVSGTLNASEIRINGQILDLASANLWDASGNDIQYNTGGKVGINTTNLVGPYSLFVRDGIITEKVVVEIEGEWPDYVFHPTYQLPSLTEVSKYIQQHKHLPEIPTAEEIEKGGLNLGEMEALMMKKIEELTLYAIEQEREKEELKEEMVELREEKDLEIEKLEVRSEQLAINNEQLEVRMGQMEREENELKQKNQALTKRLDKLEDMMKALMNK